MKMIYAFLLLFPATPSHARDLTANWVVRNPLPDGATAVALFNRGAEPAKITVNWSALKLKSVPTHAKDLRAHNDLKLAGPEYSNTVPAHGVVLLRLNSEPIAGVSK